MEPISKTRSSRPATPGRAYLKKAVSVKLPPELYQAGLQLAAAQHRPFSNYLVVLLAAAVKTEKEKQQAVGASSGNGEPAAR